MKFVITYQFCRSGALDFEEYSFVLHQLLLPMKNAVLSYLLDTKVLLGDSQSD